MTHFTENEKILLAMLVKDHPVIENKKTDAATVQIKQQEWEKLTVEYNAQPETNNSRTANQLKTLWKNLKQKKRKLNTELRYKSLTTGGGPPPKVDDDPIMSIVSDAAPYMDVTLSNTFDSTAAFEDEVVEVSNVPQCSTSTSCLDSFKPVTAVTPVSSSNLNKRKRTVISSDEATLRCERVNQMILHDLELHQTRMEITKIEKEKAEIDLEISKLKLKALKKISYKITKFK